MSCPCPREFGQRIFEELGWRRWGDLGILDQIGTHEMLTSQAGAVGGRYYFDYLLGGWVLVVFFGWFGVRFDLNKKFGLMVRWRKFGLMVFVDVLLMVTVGLMAFILQGCDRTNFWRLENRTQAGGVRQRVANESLPAGVWGIGNPVGGFPNNILGESRWWFQRFVIQVNGYLSKGLRPPN